MIVLFISDICKLPYEVGPCKAFVDRWYFDWNSSQCKRFIYGGCEGNGNIFSSFNQCQRICKGSRVYSGIIQERRAPEATRTG